MGPLANDDLCSEPRWAIPIPMTNDRHSIERHLSYALGDRARPSPQSWAAPGVHQQVVEEILYHGIAGLLIDRIGSLEGWPDEIVAPVHRQAIAQTMWELRHRAVLAELVSALGQEGIVPLFLKGTAIAYDLYKSPANRSRGDTDLLIHKSDVQRARTVLEAIGYRSGEAEKMTDVALQETWSLGCDDGTQHLIDLHVQVMNSPALQDMFDFEECAANSIALPRLSPDARGLDRPRAMIHTCMHRAMHVTAPYLVEDRTYYGSDRLIWIHDIRLLADALTAQDWRQFCSLARQYGASAVCLDGLRSAERMLGADIPEKVSVQLSDVPGDERASHYLLRSRQLGRALQDLRAVRGGRRKLAYLRSRIWPSQEFVRSKYRDGAGKPVAQLYMRRMWEFLRPRPTGGGKG
jgi:hypothetical protein